MRRCATAFPFSAAYRAARELGLCIPEELSVVGYDDHQLAVLVGPGLTTLAWDAVVEAAVGQLAASGYAIGAARTGASAFALVFSEPGSAVARVGFNGVVNGAGRTPLPGSRPVRAGPVRIKSFFPGTGIARFRRRLSGPRRRQRWSARAGKP